MNRLISIGLCSDDPKTNAKIADKGSFTYDEGGGVKDTIVIDGPLSQVFTKALNLYFSKKPLELKQEDSLSKAFESAAIHTTLSHHLSSLEQEEDSDEQLRLFNNKYEIVSANHDVLSDPKIIIDVVSANSELFDNSEVIEANSDSVKNAGKEYIVFVAPEFGVNGDIKSYDSIDLGAVGKINAINISQDFKRATESFFDTRGIDVVVGFENLCNRLLKLSRGI